MGYLVVHVPQRGLAGLGKVDLCADALDLLAHADDDLARHEAACAQEEGGGDRRMGKVLGLADVAPVC